jgi:hypothetical protein
MREDKTPYAVTLLAALALLVPSLGSRISSPPRDASSASREAATASEPVPASWRDPLQPLQEFFGLPVADRSDDPAQRVVLTAAPAAGGGSEISLVPESSAPPLPGNPLAALAKAAAAAGYRVDIRIALVPDPLDSYLAVHFDAAISALQSAHADSGYLADRTWIPWQKDFASKRLYRRAPGVLLFRRGAADERKDLSVVLLVGETPKIGFHKEALAQAIAMAHRWKVLTRSDSPIDLLGPSFSGTAEPLQRALERDGLGPASFRIVTGSATAPGLEDFLGREPFFRRTVLPDNVVEWSALAFLEEKMGWDLDQVAEISEADTAYGRGRQDERERDHQAREPPASEADQERDDKDALDAHHLREHQIVRVTLPAGLAGIRSAWEDSRPAPSPGGPMEAPKTSIDLKLADRSQPVDLVPEFSTLTVAAKDLAINNLVAALSRTGIRYVGLLFTDPRDKLFLAQRIREYSPGVILFAFDNSLLYGHPQYAAAMDGTLVFSSFPLFPEGRRWRRMLGGPADVNYRRQFGSELQQGIYQAALILLAREGSPPELGMKRVWVTAVGNGSLWPLAAIRPVKANDEVLELSLPERNRPDRKPSARSAPAKHDFFEQLTRRADLQLVLVAAGLALLAYGLWREICRGVPTRDWRRGWGTATLLGAAGGTVLAFAAAALAVLGTLPFFDMPWLRVAILVAIVGVYLAGLAYSLRAARHAPHLTIAALGVAALAAAAAIATLPWTLERLWWPGGSALFYLRAHQFASGLSPFVSLVFLTAAFYIAIFLEARRRRLSLHQGIGWPLRASREAPLAHTSALLRDLHRLLEQAPPKRGLILAAGLVLAPLLLLLRTVQPIAESGRYGQIVVFLIALGMALAVRSFHRFLALWSSLKPLLSRLGYTRFAAAFQRVAPEVRWNPMKTFSWQLPTYNLLVLSSEKLKEVAARGGFAIPGGPARLDRWIADFYAGSSPRALRREIAARRKLQRLFAAACVRLEREAPDPAIDDFLAVRIIAYIRYAFGHMRYALSSALLTSLFVVAALRTYAFEPKQFYSACVWGGLLAGVVLTFWIFLAMDRHTTLSLIGNTTPGKVTLDRHLLANFLTYAAIPLLGFLATLFPQAGSTLTDGLSPLLRILGAG